MPQTFGELLAIEIKKKLDLMKLKQVHVVKKSIGIDPKIRTSDIEDHQKEEFDRRTRRMSELVKGVSADPVRDNYLPFCEVLEISPKRLTQLREQAASTYEQPPGWPELKTTHVPENLVVRDFRHGVLGATVIKEAEEAYENSKERIRIHPHGVGVYTPTINEFLLKSQFDKLNIPISFEKKYLAYNSQNDEDCQLLSHITNEKINNTDLFNSKKIRLCNNVPEREGSIVHLSETDYCSSLLTDQLAFKEIYIDVPKNRKVLRDGLDEFIHNGKLIALEDADRMSNQLGASTFAFSKDGKLLHVEQTQRNAQSMGLLAPSGSGSLDWEDVFEKRKEDIGSRKSDLLSIVSTGAARELVEESGLHKQLHQDDLSIRPEEVAENYLKVFGFSRMLHRGGKPEFYCVAVLPFSQFGVEEAELSEEEVPYTRRTVRSRSKRVDFNGSVDEIKNDILEVCEEFMGPFSVDMLKKNKELDFLSFPLSHGLELLIEAIEGPYGDSLIAFLKSASARLPNYPEEQSITDT